VSSPDPFFDEAGPKRTAQQGSLTSSTTSSSYHCCYSAGFGLTGQRPDALKELGLIFEILSVILFFLTESSSTSRDVYGLALGADRLGLDPVLTCRGIRQAHHAIVFRNCIP
jgi:hypothetical protein